MPSRIVTIVNRNGLHARPAAEIVKTAARYKSDIVLIRDDLEVNGKSIMGVMMLAAECGATLTLRKTFATPTWESSFEDSLSSTMRVGASGKYTWHVNQSTRPVVQAKLVEVTEDSEVRSQTFTGGPTTIGQAVDHEFTMTETGMDLLGVTLDWPTPDDLDLEVYRKNADGSLTQVSSSGNIPGEKESLEIADVLGLPGRTDPEKAIEENAAAIREKLNLHCVVIHPREGAAADE